MLAALLKTLGVGTDWENGGSYRFMVHGFHEAQTMNFHKPFWLTNRFGFMGSMMWGGLTPKSSYMLQGVTLSSFKSPPPSLFATIFPWELCGSLGLLAPTCLASSHPWPFLYMPPRVASHLPPSTKGASPSPSPSNTFSPFLDFGGFPGAMARLGE